MIYMIVYIAEFRHMLLLFILAVEQYATKLLKRYFDKYGKFSSESDMRRLETVLV